MMSFFGVDLPVFFFFSQSRCVLQEGFTGRTECDRFKSEFACSIANAISNWLIIFTQLSIMGVAFITLGSAGNSIYAKADCWSLLHLLIGMAYV